MNRRMTQRSRFLSLVLRHQPQAAGIKLDSAGWVEVETLLQGMSSSGHPLSRAELETLVTANDKQRFTFSNDGKRIRANQGHSVDVELGLAPAVPPSTLYHGTVGKFLDSILQRGLEPGQRHHVHLTADRHTAFKVGSRRGTAIVLEVNASAMVEAQHIFYLSANGVWLTDTVPAKFLKRLE